MKRICTLLLAAGLLFGAATGASAIDFNAKGQWLMGFGVGNASPMDTYRANGVKTKGNTEDDFQAAQRLRLQLDAVASESLSGTVYFEIGTTQWGKSSSGGALGADANNAIKLKRAYIDWAVPQSDAKVRMGIQGVALPNVAGGSAIMDTDVAGITVNYKFNDNVGLTALWARPLNDNYVDNNKTTQNNYLDNMDLFSLMVPLTFDGVKVTPWAMYGMVGKNALNRQWDTKSSAYDSVGTSDGNLPYSLRPYPGIGATNFKIGKTGNDYGTAFWAGLPVAITLWDPLNIELDINYGYMQGMGRFDALKSDGTTKRSSTERQGWLAKALVEYKLDWGVPGIFGWYASGDDGNPKNGSQRMPSIAASGNFTSFIGDGNMGWIRQDYSLTYDGTWGIGAQVRDISFVEDLKHTLRVAYWGGTNSTGMVKYMNNAHAWADGWGNNTGPYLTTNDGMVEFNLVNSYKIYENLEMNLELDYVINCMDNSTWKKANDGNAGSFSKQDMWKAQVVFAYSF
ncbi:MAG: outer membrane homotrimeric porin [Desulfovibrio sp.]|uniref:outer membrane homotrimeric porin n=1 Tax=Desulfovibrio sp. TaxID=885 RepID=UPI002A360613|nr:outer membrane homotrimeric porin [Desulfovibrio sp.]MDY0259377.1 outer membrane homotrimeric porin [Desulfovibrio sp.]